MLDRDVMVMMVVMVMMTMEAKVKLLSRVQLFATPWTVAY